MYKSSMGGRTGRHKTLPLPYSTRRTATRSVTRLVGAVPCACPCGLLNSPACHTTRILARQRSSARLIYEVVGVGLAQVNLFALYAVISLLLGAEYELRSATWHHAIGAEHR